MLILKKHDELKRSLDIFVWEFKIGDNILYNLGVISNLVDDYNNLIKDYKKPISVLVASIIEAVMVDFIYRLYNSTKHFPQNLESIKEDIKLRLSGETIKFKYKSIDGKELFYPVLKNFNFASVVDVYREFKLFGDNENIYNRLEDLAHFRNRLHILNYYNNFEKDEKDVFSEARVQRTINIMEWMFTHFEKEYSRPWSKSAEK